MLKDNNEVGTTEPKTTIGLSMPGVRCVVSDGSGTTGTLQITIPGLSADQVTAICENFSGLEYIGDGVFTRHVIATTDEEKQALMERYSTDIRAFMETNHFLEPTGSVAWKMGDPASELRLMQFLSGRDPGTAPPRPGSHELARQSIIIDAVRKRNDIDVDQAIHILTKHVETLDPTPTEAEKDPAIAALGALRRVKEEAHKKKIRSRLKWVFSLLFLIGIGVAFYFYGSLLYTRGHYTTIATCKVPFGDSEITGNRYSTFTTKSLLGYRVGADVPETETTEIKLPGENLTVLGFDSTTSKWWRVNYGKGEANTPKLRVTDMYWFVGDKDKTSLVKYDDFCK